MEDEKSKLKKFFDQQRESNQNLIKLYSEGTGFELKHNKECKDKGIEQFSNQNETTVGIELDLSKFLKYLNGQSREVNYMDIFASTGPAAQRVALMEAAQSIDMPNIRAEDRPYVHEVIQYLRQNGLRTELKGSAEFSKEYNDIDILAKGSLEDVANTVCGLKKIDNFGAKSFYETAADGKKYEVAYEGAEVRYMNTRIAQLFRITVGDTKIHVGLKAKKPIFGGNAAA